MGSWLDARSSGAEWLVRIEDVDRDRVLPGATDDILRTLEAFGLGWDGPVVRQSARSELYAAALDRLRGLGVCYPCSCTRGEIAAGGDQDARYPGTCRAGPRRLDGPHAWRWAVPPGPVSVVDRLHGTLTQDVQAEVGDFVLRRRNGCWSYQLAVVVDDGAQGITDVVRGLDLLDNTPRQRRLQEALALPAPSYLHLPLLVEPDGGKLAKSVRSVPVESTAAPAQLSAVLALLRHPVPAALAGGAPSEQLAWATSQWSPERLRAVRTVAAPARSPA